LSKAWSPVLTRTSGAGLGLGKGVKVGNGMEVEVGLENAGAGVLKVILGATCVGLLQARLLIRNIEQLKGILLIICATITQESQGVN